MKDPHHKEKLSVSMTEQNLAKCEHMALVIQQLRSKMKLHCVSLRDYMYLHMNEDSLGIAS